MRAFLLNSLDGLKTRFSIRCDSMLFGLLMGAVQKMVDARGYGDARKSPQISQSGANFQTFRAPGLQFPASCSLRPGSVDSPLRMQIDLWAVKLRLPIQ